MPEPTPDAYASPHASDVRAARIGTMLLLLATAILLWACTRNLGGQWDNGLRGNLESRFSHVTVGQHVSHGLAATLGLPAFIVVDHGEVIRSVNFHHPPGYWLYLSLWGWLFGNTQLVLRLAHLTLFVPGLFALYLLVRRRAGDVAAGASALLFASCPLVGYYGPMVLQDGAVLGFGLLTLWAFQRHCDAPSWRRWLVTAALFFIAASWDYSGYWWGPAMFVLALDQRRRGPAVVRVLSLLPVAALAFGVMALHYGLVYGGPIGFVHELLGMLKLEREAVGSSVTFADFERAMRYLWLDHQNVWLLALAGLGCVLAPFVRGSARLLVVAFAMLVPGLLNYGLMFRHAVDHVFWSLHGFAGLAALGAIPSLAAARLWHARWRGTSLLSMAATASVVVLGMGGTRELYQRFAFHDQGDSIAVIEKAVPLLAGCSTAITSAPVTPQFQFGATTVEYGCNDAASLDVLLAIGRANKLPGEFGFILDPAQHDSPLRTKLDTMATATEVDGVRVYRFRF